MKAALRLTATELKCVAIIAMTIDHIAYVFISDDSPAYFFMRLIGRLTAPIMTYMLVESFIHTSNKKKYALRLFGFALISQLPFSLMIYRRIPNNILEIILNLNVLFGLLLSLFILEAIASDNIPILFRSIIIAVCIVLSDICDLSYLIPAWTLLFYVCRGNSNIRNVAFIIVSTIILLMKFLPNYDSFSKFCFMFGVLAVPIPLGMYNGERSRSKKAPISDKWFFYVYYPFHMVALSIISIFI